MEAEASFDLIEGKITEEEFAVREERALECTLDMKRILVQRFLNPHILSA